MLLQHGAVRELPHQAALPGGDVDDVDLTRIHVPSFPPQAVCTFRAG